MKHLLVLFVCLVPSLCYGQTAFVDPRDNVQIKTNLNNLQYGGSRTIHFDENGPTVEANLPADVGYIYIYNAETRKGVIEFSRPSVRYYYYPLYNDRSRGHYHRLHSRW